MIVVPFIGLIVCSFLNVACAYFHEGPVIGVVAQEMLPSLRNAYPNYNSYIAASYIKAVEAAGARAVPIMVGQSYSYYKKLLSMVNGVVLPGGACYYHTKKGYAEAASHVYRIAIQMNRRGDYFPILGVCLGFQILMYLGNNKRDLKTNCMSENVGLPLTFVKGFERSRLFKNADPKIISILENSPVTANHHQFCITPTNMTRFKLTKSWRTLSVNTDNTGKLFVSSVESRRYPFAGIQWHPEKSMYEWKADQNNPHSREAILSERHFYDWIATEASKNHHKYPSTQLKDIALIDNYPVFYSGGKNLYFEQVYLFK